MKRIQLFEFEDFSWFPDWLRSALTRLIVVLLKLLGISEVLAQLIKPVLASQKLDTIVDLGSGAGGAMPELLAHLKKDKALENLKLTLTDLYPNQMAIKQFNADTTNDIQYHKTSVDATNIASAPAGLKTMVNCFHHMPPDAARQILASAQENKQALLIYEMVDNKLPLLVWWLFLPLSLVILMVMVWVMTPFVRPLTWRQLLFTYLIPIIPVVYAWDGQASMPRIYNHQDLDHLLATLPESDYTWTKGFGNGKNGKAAGIYLLGLPKN
ncbi:MAG: class I SAM-dependent methyltransferase [Saprospiraceae bacterium]